MTPLLHILGCVLPFLLIFTLPLFGVSEGVTMFIFVVLMFSCHLVMMRGHRHDEDTLDTGTTERDGK